MNFELRFSEWCLKRQRLKKVSENTKLSKSCSLCHCVFRAFFFPYTQRTDYLFLYYSLRHSRFINWGATVIESPWDDYKNPMRETNTAGYNMKTEQFSSNLDNFLNPRNLHRYYNRDSQKVCIMIMWQKSNLCLFFEVYTINIYSLTVYDLHNSLLLELYGYFISLEFCKGFY